MSLSRVAGQVGLPLLFAASTLAPNIARADVNLGCFSTPETIKEAQSQLVAREKMVPTVSHYKNIGTDDSPQWAMATLMVNPGTKRGYEWAAISDNFKCVMKKYSNVVLFNNTAFDPKAFLEKSQFPNANLTGNGSDISSVGINAALIVSKNNNQYPMYRADVDSVFSISVPPESTKAAGTKKIPHERYVEYLVANPVTTEGTILAANMQGNVITNYYNVVGSPKRDGVRNGAIYTPAGKDMIASLPPTNSEPIALAGLDRK